MSSSQKIIFDNEHFIIVDKMPNILSVPARTGLADKRLVLGRLLEEELGMRLFPVHRLDYEVSGLIIFAKTEASQKSANSWFEKKEVTKTYRAISSPIGEGSDSSLKIGEDFLWKCKLLRGKKRAYESPVGKDSLTKARLIKRENDNFHWELCPITGRSHQLRYELYRHGHGIHGDVLYSSTKQFSPGGIALRAFKIDFSLAPDKNRYQLPDLLEIENTLKL